MKLSGLVFLFLYAITSSAYEFKNFKLSPELERKKQEIEEGRRVRETQGFQSGDISGLSSGLSAHERPAEGEIYREIAALLVNNYQDIAHQQVTTLWYFNSTFDLGERNFAGIDWQKPMGSFSIRVNRQIMPSFYGPMPWIVSDTFKIAIDAETYLNGLKEDDLIEISEDQLGAFAGVSFVRLYTYNHFAASYEEGLYSDYSKAYLSFMKFRVDEILHLEPDEYLSKEDFLTSKAGGVVSTPPFYGVAAGASVLLTYDRLARVTVESGGNSNASGDSEFLRISLKKSNAFSVGAMASLHVDFFNLLKITLLSYEITYNWEDEYQFFLNFLEDERYFLENDTPVSREVSKLLQLRKSNEEVLDPFLLCREERESKNWSSNFIVALLGAVKRHDSERIQIEKNGIDDYFFRSYDTVLNYIENPLSFLIGCFIRKLLGFNPFAVYEASKRRELALEYHAASPGEGRDPPSIVVESEEDLSIRWTRAFSARQTTGKIFSPIKKMAVKFAKEHTELDSDIIRKVKNEVLIGPMTIRTTIQINAEGIEYFNGLSSDAVYGHITQVCGAFGGKGFFSSFFGKTSGCVKALKKKYKKYKKDLVAYSDMHLWKLRSFLLELQEKTNNKNNVALFFGSGNVFYEGYFKAQTKSGFPFQTYFNKGTFAGSGIIDSFLREEDLRSPAYVGSIPDTP